MIMTYLFSAGVFVQLALLCYVLGLLTRNELLLRVLLLVGTIFYIIYYYFVSDVPLWDAIWSSAVIGAVNLLVMFQIFVERTTVGMSAKMLELYRFFPTLNPGQFRKIMKTASWVKAEDNTKICEKGVRLNHLFLVASGDMVLQKDGIEIAIGPGNFVGEISYLIDGPATADVIAPKGTEFVRWERKQLSAQLQKSAALSNGLSALFNRDIALKLSTSRPNSTHAKLITDTSLAP